MDHTGEWLSSPGFHCLLPEERLHIQHLEHGRETAWCDASPLRPSLFGITVWIFLALLVVFALGMIRR